MREAEFKEWLEANGANTDTGRNTRTHAVRTIEKQMGQLGSAHADLEAAWADDQFRQLRDRIKSMRLDAQAGGQDFRILMPNSENPLNRLSSWNSWLGQYGRFLAGKAPGTKDADRIRQYVLETYIEPARQEERPTTEVLVSDVNRALGLNQAWPNICQALKGEQFLEMADVPPPEQIGADASSATRFRFDLVNAIGRHALDKLRQRFLTAYPDFVSFLQPGGFAAEEDAYKRALIARTSELLATGDRAAPEEVGRALLDLLVGDGGLDSNLLGWRMANGLRAVRERHPGTMEGIAGELALAADPVEGINSFMRDAWPLLSEGQKSMPYGDSRTIPSMLAALVAPDRTMGIRTEPTITVANELLGRRLFANAPITTEELQAANALAREIFAVMRDEWHWQPRDLWDVQGFIWVIGQNNTAILARFDRHPAFAQAMKEWTSQETLAFCTFARSINEVGLDWWHVDIKPWQLRFGRKSPGKSRAGGVVGYLHGSPARITFNRKAGPFDLGLKDGLPLSKPTGRRIENALQKIYPEITRWLPRTPARPGFWPDELEIEPGQNPTSEETPVSNSTPAAPTNLILYGPPGTGKTYATAFEAVALCDGLARGEAMARYPEDEAGRAALMSRYRELREADRIEFVTFHQSYSYEDFVERLMPKNGEESGGQAGFTLKPEPGVFRRIAERAETPPLQAGSEDVDLAKVPIYKMSLGEAANPAFDYVFTDSITNGYALFGFETLDWSDPKYADSGEILSALQRDFPADNYTVASGAVSLTDVFRNQLQVGDMLVVSKGNKTFRAIGVVEGEYEYVPKADGHYSHRRKVRWLWHDPQGRNVSEIYDGNFTMRTIYRLKDGDLNRAAIGRLIAQSSGGPQEVQTAQPHVLIIDELNRANISKVFGELITLIEPDKRLGQNNELTVTLPYSNKTFGVPANLHIIGTMNTADRSIALLDTALRRRFDFREIAPNPDLLGTDVAGANLRQVLTTINQRIEYLVDREHRIGHAFFITCKTRGEIDAAMRNKVIPLLQEYFFEDWSRVHAVLGDEFIGQASLTPPPGFDAVGTSWFVKTEFAENAYDRLGGKAAAANDDKGPASEDEAGAGAA